MKRLNAILLIIYFILSSFVKARDIENQKSLLECDYIAVIEYSDKAPNQKNTPKLTVVEILRDGKISQKDIAISESQLKTLTTNRVILGLSYDEQGLSKYICIPVLEKTYERIIKILLLENRQLRK